ncbi:MAG: hypothetical protein LBK75_08710 [Oscillospiraceae bacterium]|jgi:hypothetical protein|nr:hypothetical protein [Oscillospiraceae bacterium]
MDENFARIGIVSAVDNANRKARVIFRDKGMTSGWLYVLQHPGANVHVKGSGDHTHMISDTYSGSGSASTDGAHDHVATVTGWMPALNTVVLVLYLPVFGGDGFILGAI